MQSPPTPLYRPERRQSEWQHMGVYVMRWVWNQDTSTWSANKLYLRETLARRDEFLMASTTTKAGA